MKARVATYSLSPSGWGAGRDYMDKQDAASFFYRKQWVFRTIVACAFLAAYTSIMLLSATPAYAEAIPGGNIANSVVRAVDIAKERRLRKKIKYNDQITTRP